MGIHDRGYYRDEPRGGLAGGNYRLPRFNAWSVTTWLIVVNVAIHLIANTALPALYTYGHFSTYTAFQRLEVWRFVTFQFLHDPSSILHLAFNMFGLWVFGGIVEETLGRRKYLAFYLVCGIFGGLLYLVLNLLGAIFHIRFPGLLFEDTRVPLIGASAGVFGVILACAYIAPKSMVRLLFPPISLSMRVFAYGYVVLAAFNLLMGGHNAGGDAAHLGGAAAGAFFIRNNHLLRDFFDVFKDSRKEKPAAPARPSRAQERQRREDSDIDAILQKISERGIQSLTAREKKLLQKDTERKRGGEA